MDKPELSDTKTFNEIPTSASLVQLVSEEKNTPKKLPFQTGSLIAGFRFASF